MVRGYAASHEVEYFAEMTVAYFDGKWHGVLHQGIYFPFFRYELKSYDKNGFELCRKIWNHTYKLGKKDKYIETRLTKCHTRCKSKCKLKKLKTKKRYCIKSCVIKCNT